MKKLLFSLTALFCTFQFTITRVVGTGTMTILMKLKQYALVLLTGIILMTTVYNAMAQCNISHSSEVLSTFESTCNGHLIKGSISNTIALSESCGHIVFTPPFVDILGYTGSEDIDNSYELFISPNPFTDRIEINLSMGHQEYTVSIYNILGQQVMEKDNFLTNEFYSINLSNLYSGSYFIVVQSDGNLRITQKIIKIN